MTIFTKKLFYFFDVKITNIKVPGLLIKYISRQFGCLKDFELLVYILCKVSFLSLLILLASKFPKQSIGLVMRTSHFWNCLYTFEAFLKLPKIDHFLSYFFTVLTSFIPVKTLECSSLEKNLFLNQLLYNPNTVNYITTRFCSKWMRNEKVTNNFQKNPYTVNFITTNFTKIR
ncbi:hypothetical protein Avbf_05455 [Armadillidium vulgare]|nr:hypothetical protein Avbf_05455 [Armadillidium vulgare]